MENSVTRVGPREPIIVKPAAEVIKIQAAAPIVVKATAATTVRPVKTDALVINPTSAVTVQPPERGAWDERGWIRSCVRGRETYEGFYTVGKRKFRGRIEVNGIGGHRVRSYIFDPPREVKYHRHGPCFQLVGNNWFHLHWSRPARNVDDAILYMERVLDESLNRNAKRK